MNQISNQTSVFSGSRKLYPVLLSKISKSQLKYMHPYSRWISNHYCKLSSVFTHENHLHSGKYIHTHKRLSCNFALVPHVEWEKKKKCKLYSRTKWHGSKEINAKGRIVSITHLKKNNNKNPPPYTSFSQNETSPPKSQTNSTPMPNVQSFTPSCDRLSSARVISRSHSLSVQSGLWKSQLSLLWYWKAIPTVCTDKCANPCENIEKGKGKEGKTWWIYKGL